MSLSRCTIDGVRNLRQVELDELAAANVFYGANGSGKTSILEAVHLLGMARSFRGQSVKSLINHDMPQCTVFGEIEVENKRTMPLGVQRRRDGDALIRVAGETVRTLAKLAEHLPLQVLNAGSFDLLTGSPTARRQYLDWGVFHVEHRFYEQWQRFQRCIKQRNNLLRHGKMSSHEIAVWSRELALAGQSVDRYRADYFSRLLPLFFEILGLLAPGLPTVEMRYRSGWERGKSYEEALDASLTTDLEQGYTHVGPQRADIRVLQGKHAAADILSRGQQKLVVCALKLAQGRLLEENSGRICTYLVDDLPSELDREHCGQVCAQLADQDSQVFITSVEAADLRALWPGGSDNLAMFHVEHGRVLRDEC
ncbi:MAG: DNA replication/repair protein RecF [Pseudomonadota bacterium]